MSSWLATSNHAVSLDSLLRSRAGLLTGTARTTTPLALFVAETEGKVAAEKWCRARGCREMASDTWTNHRLSIAAHQVLGYAIDGRYVNFRKSIWAANLRGILVVAPTP